MFFCSEIERYMEPVRILDKIEVPFRPSLMNPSDLSFLCGCIKKFRPSKLVEVGVALGGTTAVIANCFSLQKWNCCISSIDINKTFHGKPTGYIFEKMKSSIEMKNISHRSYYGAYSMDVLESIGGY